jgi:hypothetical protein
LRKNESRGEQETRREIARFNSIMALFFRQTGIRFPGAKRRKIRDGRNYPGDGSTCRNSPRLLLCA